MDLSTFQARLHLPSLTTATQHSSEPFPKPSTYQLCVYAATVFVRDGAESGCRALGANRTSARKASYGQNWTLGGVLSFQAAQTQTVVRVFAFGKLVEYYASPRRRRGWAFWLLNGRRIMRAPRTDLQLLLLAQEVCPSGCKCPITEVN